MTRMFVFAAGAVLFASTNASAQVVWGLWGFPTGASNHARIVTFPVNAPQSFTVIGETGFDINMDYAGGLDFDGTGNLYAAGLTNTNFLYSVSKTTGATTLIGGSGLGANRTISDLSYDRFNNRMLAIAIGLSNPEVYSINTSTGAATSLGAVTGTSESVAVAFAVRPSDGAMFMFGVNTNRWYSINPSTLAATPLNPFLVAADFFGQGGTFDPNTGDLLHSAVYNGGFGSLYRIDQTTGAATDLGFLGGDPFGGYQVTDIAIQPIPEPASVLLASATGAVWIVRRRLKKRKG